jgi:hypothetical protein
MFVDVSEQSINPIFKGKAFQTNAGQQIVPLLHKGCCGRRSVVLEVNEPIRSLEHEVATQM